MSKFKLSEIVKDNTATFSFYRQGYIYYTIPFECTLYSFPVEVADLAGATVSREEKGITLMRYIRKAIDNEMFVRVSR